MCGRYALNIAPASAVPAAVHKGAAWASVDELRTYGPRNAVFPTTYAPVAYSRAVSSSNQNTRSTLANEAVDPSAESTNSSIPTTESVVPSQSTSGTTTEVVVRMMRWGLVPSFMKKDQISQTPPLINARGESVLEKPSFRAIKSKSGSRRCVVVASGYYEWFTDPGPPGPTRGRPPAKKFPYLVRSESLQESESDAGADANPQSVPMLLAGLYDTWRGDDADSNDPTNISWSFAIVTMNANDQISWLHSRMPVVLESEYALRTWLDSSCPPERACDIVMAESGRTKYLAWTGMVKDLSVPLPPNEQGKPKPHGKIASINSFFSSPASKASSTKRPTLFDTSLVQKVDDPEVIDDAEPVQKRARTENTQETVVLDGDASEERPSPIANRRGFKPGKRSPNSRTAQGTGSVKSPRLRARNLLGTGSGKDGKQRAISDFFKPK